MTEYRSLRLREDLCAQAEKWMAGRFENLESLITVLLQEISAADARKFDAAEEEMINQRLRDLGYL